ncbi:MAG: ABC transporter permease [Betaproteobacteria bacterium]|nr:ABC transporter permease [Betaproteobacteria bacterium]
MSSATATLGVPAADTPPSGESLRERFGGIVESIAIPLGALLVAMGLFGLFMFVIGKDPLQVYRLIYKGGFSSAFAWQNTLQRGAPLILTALCVALPAQAGLIIIGGEGALVLGALAAAVTGHALDGSATLVVQIGMALAGMVAGGLWIALAGGLRQYRGVNETISSLLLTYIAIAVFNQLVEGPLRDPASLNKPSTMPIGDANMIGSIPGLDVHWGLVYGIVFCVLSYGLVRFTTPGFAVRVVGGNVRAARLVGLPVGALVLGACFLGGAAAGLAGMVEVAAVHGTANASLIAGYGYAGILVAFIARHNALAIVPVAILLGGINASGGMLQRHLDLPDATVLVLQGIAFMTILASETLYGRWQGRGH